MAKANTGGNNAASNCAPVKNPLRSVFRNYFKARYQNFQNIVSNAEYYADMPNAWVTYQNAYVRQWDEWASGFVPSLHRGNFFATGMGKTVIDILVRECMKGGYRFDGVSNADSKFITEWAEKTQFSDIIELGFHNANRLGNNILRLNIVRGKGEAYCTSHPVNRTYFEVNRRDQVVKARFIDMLANGTAADKQYYTMEDRVAFNGKNYYRIKVYVYESTATYAAWDEYPDLNRLEPCVLSHFTDLYGNVALGQWYELPFKTLGCYNWKNTSASSAISQMTGFADSSLHTALDILYSIDYNYSMGQLDQYFGKTRVITPKAMTKQTRPVIHNGVDIGEVLEQVAEAPLEDDVYSEVPAGDNILDKPIQPLFIQPDLRGEARKYIRDSDLELLASKVGLSSSTLANHLNYNKSKTATEVDSEKDTTDITVETKRRLANRALDAMLKDLCEFYNLASDVDVTWNLSGKGNKEDILLEYNKGLMPLKQCIKRLHPELTEAEVDEWVTQLKEEKQASSYDTSLNGIFGLGDEH